MLIRCYHSDVTNVSGTYALAHPWLHDPGPAQALSWSAQWTVDYGGYYQQYTYWPIKYAPETEGFRRYLVLNSLIIFQVCWSSQRWRGAWLQSQITRYLSCLENPTDACSVVCNAKEDVLASYQDCLGFALTRVFKIELAVYLGYHDSCLTQRLGSHKYAESVMYLLPYNIILLLVKEHWLTS